MTRPRNDESPSERHTLQPLFVVVPVEEDYVTLLTKTPQGAIAVTKVEHKNLFIAKNGRGEWPLSKRAEQRVAYAFAGP